MPTNPVWKTTPARISAALAALLLAALALAGCGGSGSTTPGGFLFAPQGGTVQPSGDIAFTYLPGTVAQGVSISVARSVDSKGNPSATGSPADGGIATLLSPVVQVSIGQSIDFKSHPAIVTLSLGQASHANARLYLLHNGAAQILPIYTPPSGVTPPANSLQATLNVALANGDQIAAFVLTQPPPGTPPV